MDFTKAIEHLDAAEQELLDQIRVGSDYGEKTRCLEYAESVHNLADELRGLLMDLPLDRTQKPTLTLSDKEEREDAQDKFPMFFVHQDKLWKIASRRGDTTSLYRKSAPLPDVAEIVSAIRKAGQTGLFTIADIEALQKDTPTYRIQLTVGALMQAELLQSSGRGKYAIVPGKPKSDQKWKDALKDLPVHTKYLEQ